MTSERTKRDGQHDFDFLVGSWKVHNWRLRERLKGSDSWEEFDGVATGRKILNGRCSFDEVEFYRESGTVYGTTMRLYDPQACEWRIYWAADQTTFLDVPMIGHFDGNGRGEFYDQELFEGRSIYARFVWTVIDENKCRWEQAFSEDGGKTWETNWINEFTRQA